MMQTTSAKSVTPSMSAAAMIMVVRMSPPADGCRAVPSIAAALIEGVTLFAEVVCIILATKA